MPDRRSHRGPHPEDAQLFDPAVWLVLRQACADLGWLLSRGYAPESSLKLVGDRYALVARQRIAVQRCASSDSQAERRRQSQVGRERIGGCELWLDGYNVLTTIEAALAGGVLLGARDGTYRDMASMHGSYRKVAETRPALELLGEEAAALRVAKCRWYLDRPVSNSGRLKAMIEQLAAEREWPWQVQLVADPDGMLIAAEATATSDEFHSPQGRWQNGPTTGTHHGVVVATADSAVLDRCGPWFNLARETIERRIPRARVTPLWDEPSKGYDA